MVKVDPHQLDVWSSQIGELYNSLEGEILRIIIRRLNSGYHDDILSWQMDKLADLHLVNQETVEYLSKVTPYVESDIKRMFEETAYGSAKQVDDAFDSKIFKPMPTNIDNIMRGYLNQAWTDIDNMVNQTLVTTNYGVGEATKAYTAVLNETSAYFNTGIMTFDQALERSVQELAQRGIKSQFIDKGGHTWSIERYARTVLKSTLNNTYNEARRERMNVLGVHTVLVTSHMGARAECSLIQGNVVDLRLPSELPTDWPYKSIYDHSWRAEYGTAGGHRGVYCGHDHLPFVPGVNTNNQPKFDLEENAEVAKSQKRQREIERQIVKFKKNRMVSEALGNEDGAQHWGEMVRKRQAVMRDHLEKNGKYLSRNYNRERVYTPLETLLNEKEKYQ